MAREKEMQEFTRSFFRSRPDLSTLTHSIVRRRFLAYAGRDHLEPEEKQALKRLVEEELVKMQVDEGGTREDKLDLTGKAKRSPTPCSDSERKRPRFNSGSEPSSAASSPDCFGRPAENGMSGAEGGPGKEEAESPGPTSKAAESSDDQEQQEDPGAEAVVEASSEEEEEEGRVGTREACEEEEEEEPKGRTRKKAVAKSKQAAGKASARRKQAREESEDELAPRAAKKGAQSPQDSGRESGEGEGEDWKQHSRSSRGKRPAPEERRLTGDSGDSGEGQIHGSAGRGGGSGSDGSDDEPLARRSKARAQGQDGDEARTAESPAAGAAGGEDSDLEREGSDSEAGGSLKERKNRSSKKSSKRGRPRSSSSSSDGSPEPKGGKAGAASRGEDHPAVTRLKRYIRACGAHRNYKKLLGSCRSHKERLSVLRAELEALGMKGNPSLEKCRALKEQREAAAEVASLDVANIISGSGRPRRRTAWNPTAAAPGELYRRTLDSEEEGPRLAPTDWSHMRGIISSDGDST